MTLQWLIRIDATPESVNRAAYCIGWSSGLKCFEVKTFLSTSVLNVFILSKIIIALHLLKIDKLVNKLEGNL